MTLSEQYLKLCAILKEMGSVAVAFSGGVDSTFLLWAAREMLEDQVVAVTAVSSFMGVSECKAAEYLAGELEVRQILCGISETAIDPFRHNPPERCYLCKKTIFQEMIRAAEAEGISYVIEGSNVDDEGDYRPGLKAIREMGIRSPLREAGLTKEMIRQLSREIGLPTWDKPSCACLASRFPYGEMLTPSKLRMVDQAEEYLREEGFHQLRVRMQGGTARIELMSDEIPKMLEEDRRKRICLAFKTLGFDYVSMDLAGYRTGSMNETLSKEEMHHE